VWASSDDTGPANIITAESTCATWTPIGLAWLENSLVEGWAGTHPGQRNPLTVPGNRWTPAERTAMQATANASRLAAVKTASLVRTTQRRVMREYYEQFIAYARGFAAVIGDAYVPTNSLGATAESAFNALVSICTTADSGIAKERSALVTAPSAPKQTAPPQDPTNPQRFLSTSDLGVCGDLLSVFKAHNTNQTVVDWDHSDHGVPADLWSPQQRALNDAVTPLLLNLADDVERTVQRSSNPVLQDFGVVSAQYLRAYVKGLPTYTRRDAELEGASRYTRLLITDACRAAGT